MGNNKNSLFNVLIGVSVIVFICGLLRGCTGLLMGDDFFKGFFLETGWLIGLVVLIVFLFVLGALFGRNKNNRF